MPLSTDNQDYKNPENEQAKTGDKKQEGQKAQGEGENEKMTSDDLKGKKVDADPTKESGKPAEV